MATPHASHQASASSPRKRQASSGWDNSTRPSSNTLRTTNRSSSLYSYPPESLHRASTGRSAPPVSSSMVNGEDEELIARFVDSLPQECLSEMRGLSLWSAHEATMAVLKRLLDLRKDNERLQRKVNLRLTHHGSDATRRSSSCAGSHLGHLARMTRESEPIVSHRHMDDMQQLHEQQIETLHEHYKNLIRQQDEELDALQQSMEELDAEKPKLTYRWRSRKTDRSSNHPVENCEDRMEELARQKYELKLKASSEKSESEKNSESPESESSRQGRETWFSLSRKLDLANEECAKTLRQVVVLEEEARVHRSTIQERDNEIVELTRMMEEEKQLRLQSEEKLTDLLRNDTAWSKWFPERLVQELMTEVRQMSGTLGELTEEVVSKLSKASVSRTMLHRSLEGHYVAEDGTVFASPRSYKTLLPAAMVKESHHLNAGLMHATALLKHLRNAVDAH
eukprot:GEMP01025666.1.p1 GENE.GEMP01025666.1~~GEMP01025666.1.p1  ORF type:complete len:453 (+),score=135.65 GEMP01025666.1:189-1547(+)